MTDTAPEAPEQAAEEKPQISEWLQKKIDAREAAKAEGIPTPPRGRRKSTAGATAPKKRTASSRPAARKPKATDYRGGIVGLGQLVAMPLAFVAPADSAAVTMHVPGIAEALTDLAKERPEVAAMLDRILAGGPYAALLAATLPLLLQLLHNHGLIPAAMVRQLGGTPKEEILAELRRQAGHVAPVAEAT